MTPSKLPIRSTPSQKRWLEGFGPWAIITGASDGIGREMARELAANGVNLVLVARRKNRLEQIAKYLAHDTGIMTRVLDTDLSRPEAVHEIIEQTKDLDIGLLVASAGFGTSGRLIDADLERELKMVDVNCKAVLIMCHAFTKRFAKRGRGGIVLMSSLLAFQGVPRTANYAATKAYIQSLAEGLAAELKPLGIDVIASAPGPINSGFATVANMKMAMSGTPPRRRARYASHTGFQNDGPPGMAIESPGRVHGGLTQECKGDDFRSGDEKHDQASAKGRRLIPGLPQRPPANQ